MKESFIPTGCNHSTTQSENLNVIQLMRQNSIEKMKQIQNQNQSKKYLKEQSSSLSEKKEEPPRKN
ncbi:unnamed protein product [Paramecium octaurelia]|uniref:Uncharacterized protein n=1 Tax=Paramecium octaurelia TaxID=43137 RepID=A0A8S1V4S1_PAROT|nr:unnamed protein product [Paramecium octaurelia]